MGSSASGMEQSRSNFCIITVTFSWRSPCLLSGFLSRSVKVPKHGLKVHAHVVLHVGRRGVLWLHNELHDRPGGLKPRSTSSRKSMGAIQGQHRHLHKMM